MIQCFRRDILFQYGLSGGQSILKQFVQSDKKGGQTISRHGHASYKTITKIGAVVYKKFYIFTKIIKYHTIIFTSSTENFETFLFMLFSQLIFSSYKAKPFIINFIKTYLCYN